MSENVERSAASVGPMPSPNGGVELSVGRCSCGSPLAQPSTGRKRIACSLRCLRRRNVLLKKIARRRRWIADWRAERGQGRYARARIDRALRDLRAELSACERALHGGPA